MGRIKGTLVKRTTKALMAKYKDQFSADVEANKKVMATVLPGIQKKIRNSVAGRQLKRDKVNQAQKQHECHALRGSADRTV